MFKLIPLIIAITVLASCTENDEIRTATTVPFVESTIAASRPAEPTSALPTLVPAGTPSPYSGEATPILPVLPSQYLRFSDDKLGIAFDYPGGWSILPHTSDDPPGMTFHGPGLGAGPEPIIFAVTVDIQPVVESTVQAVVDEQMGQVPPELKGGIKRKTLTVGGEPAAEVIGLPSLGGAVETFVLHKGQLYLVILQPYDEANSSLAPYLAQARSEYDVVIRSWKFLE